MPAAMNIAVPAPHIVENKIVCFNPVGYPPKVAKKSLAPRLETLDGKTVYLIDSRFDDSIELLKEVASCFASHMPAVTVKLVSLAGMYPRDAAAVSGTRAAASPNYAAWNSKRNWDVQENLKAFAESHGWTLPQMSLAWLLSRPAMATVIAGADKPEHIAQNIKALEIKFTSDDLIEIDRLTLVDEDRSVAPVYRKLRPEEVHEF
jgi:Aldo/keto reductase family